MIYLDYCATTPISEQSLGVFTKASIEYFGNPNSLHDEGVKAKALLEKSRETIAGLINGEKDGIYFTGGGSDSNNLAIKSLVKGKKGHIITTNIEHFSVTNTFLQLEEEGFEVSFLNVDKQGKVTIKQLESVVTKETILVSIGHANSDIGTIQNLTEIGKFLKERGILFHSDCVQSFGKIAVDVKKFHLDSISTSSHKIYGPKGVGAVYINPQIKWTPIIPNTVHEKGFRAGTINVPAIAAFSEAAIHICTNMEKEQKRLQILSQLLLLQLNDLDVQYDLIGHTTERLGHHLSITVENIEGQLLMLELNKMNIAISTGTACKVGEQNASKTMINLGYATNDATKLVRISLGKNTTENNIKQTAAAIKDVVEKYK